MKIAILDDYQDVVRQLGCFELLSEHEVKVFHNSAVGVGQLAIRLAPFDALVLIRERTRLPRALLLRLPNLKLISQTGKVAGHIDLETARERGIAVTEGIGDPTAPAELTWTLIMASMRRLVNYTSLLQQGLWQTASVHAAQNQLGRVLSNRRLGIWGYGRIGRLVAGYGRAFGMHVVVWGSEASLDQALQDGYQVASSKQDFFASCDVLSLHLRLNDATRGIVTRADLAQMQPDALFVNTSRAELVEPGALEQALDAGRPGFAALDVFESEPLPLQHPLLRRENVLATPHLGYVEKDSYELYFSVAFQNVVNFAKGMPTNLL
ncbi:D-2-hydroxyacid dehydrogenase family protein [Undibacterium oligocarboniphilum]|uniref:D-2-hydroxyacid dehydrogenase family protein n=1 Tax=Undibacterium oligocarboniphilum TaxID=666702 RepID=A0A850QJZ6_9BURK|nr:D-2-hydroxyacid dehydrogenase family protein [Undibacterium oligocarboniphilum]MBC3869324.1 D-2-hydroxyacid dehydrogenase family protein [Undibacterium oligocarboniphilum]NVO77703.1 D-2-hydroxyacid dehydrogenase family protein [Undibacterium oligocarboniphilum]